MLCSTDARVSKPPFPFCEQRGSGGAGGASHSSPWLLFGHTLAEATFIQKYSPWLGSSHTIAFGYFHVPTLHCVDICYYFVTLQIFLCSDILLLASFHHPHHFQLKLKFGQKRPNRQKVGTASYMA